jgi:nucleotide-binding universal stress UspA family protein
MKRILVGVDGSDESQAATQAAARLARSTQSVLELAYVLPELAEAAIDSSVLKQQNETARAQRGYLLLQRLAQEVPFVRVNVSLLEGRPALRLAEEAKRPDVWLLVVGHRGRGSIERKVLGSVADSLTQISPKPVLVVR